MKITRSQSDSHQSDNNERDPDKGQQQSKTENTAKNITNAAAEKGENQSKTASGKSLSGLSWFSQLKKGDKRARKKAAFTALGVTLLLSLTLFAGFVLGNWKRPQLMFDLQKGGIISAGDTFKTVVKKTAKATVMAPYYWAKSNFMPNGLDTIYLDVKFKHMHKLHEKRDEAMAKGQLIQGDDDYVPGDIRFKDKMIPVKLRLKGDWTDHLKGHKWSFRVKTKGKHELYGTRVFSFQAPWTRGYQAEALFMNHLRREGIIAPRYQFVHLLLNGKDLGVMAFEEHFSKELLESQGRKESVIVRFDETYLWESLDKNGSQDIYANYTTAEITPFQEGTIAKSPVLQDNLKNATGLLRGFVQGTLPADQVFDARLMGRFLGVSEVWDSGHQLAWTNLRFYYNPITAKLEPVAYDASANFPSEFQGLMVTQHTALMRKLLDNPSIRKSYIDTVNRVGKEMADGSLIKTIRQEEAPLLAGLRKEFPMLQPFDFTRLQARAKGLTRLTKEHFPSYKNYAFSGREIQYPKLAQAYWINPDNGHPYLNLVNMTDEPLEVTQIRYQDSTGHWLEISLNDAQKKIEPTSFDVKPTEWRFDSLPSELIAQENPKIEYVLRLAGNAEVKESGKFKPYVAAYTKNPLPQSDVDSLLTQFSFLRFNAANNELSVKSGDWTVNQSIVLPDGVNFFIPAGTTMRFSQDARIFARASMSVAGTKEQPVLLTSQSSAPYWQGVVVMQAETPSKWTYVTVENTKGHEMPDWTITGSTTFYRSDVNLLHCTFKNNLAEDALNIVHSHFLMDDVAILKTASDAFDSDFSEGTVKGGHYAEIGGDGIDVSGTTLKILGTSLEKIHDKAISIGEASSADVSGVTVANVGTGVASKDASTVKIKDSAFENINHVGMMAYVKKPEYGGAKIEAKNNTLVGTPKDYLAQTGSEMIVDEKSLTPEDIDVDKLYKEGYMKKY